MDAPTIVRERNLKTKDVLAQAVVVAMASFFMSVPIGVCVTIVAALAVAAFISHNEPSPDDQRPVVLEIGSQGLAIRKRWVREVEISWQDIEAMHLSRGRKGAVILDIRVTEPERYLGRFMRANLVMSRYQVSVRVSGLQLSPKEIALTIENAQAVFLKNFPSQKMDCVKSS